MRILKIITIILFLAVFWSCTTGSTAHTTSNTKVTDNTVVSKSTDQKILWLAQGSSEPIYISSNNLTKEVLKFYDLYNFYFDFSGFTKDSFIEYFDGDEDWEWIYEIEERIVITFRTHIEGGSAVYVIYIDKENIHMIAFSNVYDSNPISTSKHRRDRFEKWFRTLLE